MHHYKDIQTLLEDLSIDNFSYTINNLLDPKNNLSRAHLLFIARDILILIKKRDKIIHLYAQIIKYIDESIKDTSGLLKTAIFEGIQIESQEEKPHAAAFKLPCVLYGLNMYDYNKIISLLKFPKISKVNYLILFSFFASHIKRYHYFEFLYKIDPQYQKDQIFNHLLNKEFEIVNNYTSYGCMPDTLQYILKYDIVEKLQMQNNFDLNKDLEISYFETSDIQESSLDSLKYAAFFGSVNCYNYLSKILPKKQSSETNNWIESHNIDYYAIGGGNYEIIKSIPSETLNIIDILPIAASSRRFSIFEWLFQNNFEPSQLFKTLCAATEANNIKVVEMIINKYDMPSFGENSENPIEIGIKSESVECVKLLLEKGIKYDPYCLHMAISKGLDDISLFILNSGNSNPSLKDKSGRNATEIAAESCSYQLAAALVPYGNITTKVLDIAAEHNNYDFLSVFMNNADSEIPNYLKSHEKKPKFTGLFIFVICSIIFIVIWVYLFNRFA
ncbi:hypothetical protein TVAG_358140 [Trichomonas vaginalis G3]|uniref:DUF3447 domain-containing protein n=1 Tax=Trichomonas vaginalis (strain ATCC PRA-98 / G3) TaxID=412133 RepID=A2ELC2_TRIV3|nr:Ankyrin repeat family [Trichomonas vaginalis G3]EAY06524.1 hypothetical protein TVAG_358140 [Trichomonas vaginalis G3]KAI5526093.1 Ankyrin repeat family [Trichomonas vaginalis G3]|eukprot:XP_001318747.1 hypothetical protein [Trichomonas vaginalis G3]